jgi:Raf kinase inhibitor-like YbhB/YbcL family protein
MRRVGRSIICLIVVVGCGHDRGVEAPQVERPTIRLKSAAFDDQGQVPRNHTCDGEDLSPPLAWAGVPEEARSLVLICEDPDAPMGTWSHWVLYDLPPTLRELRGGMPKEASVTVGAGGEVARQGTNDFGKIGYGGPCPPGGTHHYVFQLYALDAQPQIVDGARRADVLKAIQGHVLASGKLVGKYGR